MATAQVGVQYELSLINVLRRWFFFRTAYAALEKNLSFYLYQNVCQVSTDDPSKRNVKVFIQRDYSRGTACRFQNKFPPELEGKVGLRKCI